MGHSTLPPIRNIQDACINDSGRIDKKSGKTLCTILIIPISYVTDARVSTIKAMTSNTCIPEDYFTIITILIITLKIILIIYWYMGYVIDYLTLFGFS